MNTPILICEDSFQYAWANAVVALRDAKWKAWNLVVQINKPSCFDSAINEMLEKFAEKNAHTC